MTRAEYIVRNLPGIPLPIVYRMMHNQVDQGCEMNVDVFIEKPDANVLDGGFDWDSTKEGIDFWDAVINKRNHKLYFDRYPKEESISTSSMVLNGGYITDIPIPIIERMLEAQVAQGNERDKFVFQCNPCASRCIGGFEWGRSFEGYGFWDKVISDKDFVTFFEMYPPVTSPQIIPCDEISMGKVYTPESSNLSLPENDENFVVYNIDEFNFKNIE